MNDYIDRMKQEKADLDERIIKAELFLKNNADLRCDKKTLLEIQIVVMQDYSEILQTRINKEEQEEGEITND